MGPGGGSLGDPAGLGPIGTIIDFAGPAAKIPSNWILCDGRAISQSVYPDLYSLIGGTVPDLRGLVCAGLDNMGGTNAGRLSTLGAPATTLGGIMGEQTHTITIAEMSANYHPYAWSWAAVGGFASGPHYNANSTPNAWMASTGGDAAHNNLQPTRVMNKIIRAF